ncbi:hypothetical protein Goarm_003765 [Gossypium armourianum]|uniref:Uncharacterized protein n=1 Tax=Gossypium armourianum TaxID=34283 RepID=A0A7J9K480_9ROSI|nr:hypothetical protein [Gossypium armourianum]
MYGCLLDSSFESCIDWKEEDARLIWKRQEFWGMILGILICRMLR